MTDSTTDDDLPELPPSAPEPLFVVELGDNGGRFAPTSYAEVRGWLDLEMTLWNQIFQDYNGIRAAKVQSVREAQNALNTARGSIDEADPSRVPNRNISSVSLERCKQQIEHAFLRLKLPHSSTYEHRRIVALAVQDPIAASFYTSVLFPAVSGEAARPPPAEIRGWRGLVEGLIDFYDLGARGLAQSVQARQEAFDAIGGRLETLYSDKAGRLAMLDKHFEQTAIAILKTRVAQRESFRLSQKERDEAFELLKDKHAKDMVAIREAFRVGQGMKAPVEYWRRKQSQHNRAVKIFGSVVGLGMVASALILFSAASWLFGKPFSEDVQIAAVSKLISVASQAADVPRDANSGDLAPNVANVSAAAKSSEVPAANAQIAAARETGIVKQEAPATAPAAALIPDAWKIGSLSLLGLFVVWSMRLLVRMLLSNIHLRTDAEERAVMVETYLALIEGGQVTEKEGRELILTALFRPAADGIVKDEGMPLNLLEFLTRSGK